MHSTAIWHVGSYGAQEQKMFSEICLPSINHFRCSCSTLGTFKFHWFVKKFDSVVLLQRDWTLVRFTTNKRGSCFFWCATGKTLHVLCWRSSFFIHCFLSFPLYTVNSTALFYLIMSPLGLCRFLHSQINSIKYQSIYCNV